MTKKSPQNFKKCPGPPNIKNTFYLTHKKKNKECDKTKNTVYKSKHLSIIIKAFYFIKIIYSLKKVL